MGKSVNKKLMVFESAPDFSDNSRALWEYVVENSDFKTFWVIKDEKMYVLLGNFKLPSRMIFLDSYMLNKNYLTIYHIMNAFNVLITDYSSVYVDFMLLNKPIIFSCPDLEKYKNDRGFIVDDPTLLMPGTIVKTQSMLLKTLDDIFEGEDYYKKERENNMKFFHKYKDGNSSRRLFTEILQTDKKGIEDSSKAMGRYFFDQSSPLSQYVKNIKTEVFFDTGNGFSEETKIVNIFKLKDEEDLITLELDIPDNVKAIRFDPDDVGRFILKCLSIKINNVKMKYKIVRGYEIDNCIYFYGFDPQITILLESKPYGKLKIEFICKDFYSSAGRIIEGFDARILDIETQLKETYKKLHDTNQQLSEIKASNSWKWTKPLRDIGRVVKGVVKK